MITPTTMSNKKQLSIALQAVTLCSLCYLAAASADDSRSSKEYQLYNEWEELVEDGCRKCQFGRFMKSAGSERFKNWRKNERIMDKRDRCMGMNIKSGNEKSICITCSTYLQMAGQECPAVYSSYEPNAKVVVPDHDTKAQKYDTRHITVRDPDHRIYNTYMEELKPNGCNKCEFGKYMIRGLGRPRPNNAVTGWYREYARSNKVCQKCIKAMKHMGGERRRLPVSTSEYNNTDSRSSKQYQLYNAMEELGGTDCRKCQFGEFMSYGGRKENERVMERRDTMTDLEIKHGNNRYMCVTCAGYLAIAGPECPDVWYRYPRYPNDDSNEARHRRLASAAAAYRGSTHTTLICMSAMFLVFMAYMQHLEF